MVGAAPEQPKKPIKKESQKSIELGHWREASAILDNYGASEAWKYLQENKVVSNTQPLPTNLEQLISDKIGKLVQFDKSDIRATYSAADALREHSGLPRTKRG